MEQQRPLVLLCGASGTGVSTIARKLYADDPYSVGDDQALATSDDVVALDLEAHLCREYKGDKRIVNAPETIPSMANVVMLPRDELYEKWKDCCRDLIEMHSKSKSANLRLLILHLTWYDSNTSEFFSPVDVRQLDRSDCRLDHVVILIDDIFDMYCRLQRSGDLYGEPVITNKALLLAGLRNVDARAALVDPDRVSQNKDKEWDRIAAARLRLEAKELALGHLMSWRRSEMIYAESLARALGAKFTVLGAKHSTSALRELTTSSVIPRTYLSHRISEVRRLNKESSTLPDDLGTWSSVVKEVNRLHFAFAENNQLLINPTAIDELRFADSTSPDLTTESAPSEEVVGADKIPRAGNKNAYRGRESAYLAARWELPREWGELLWIDRIRHSKDSFVEIPSEHTDTLTRNLAVDDDIALSVARSLEARIFEEVSFRDHVIVESTPHLCVYRPFFSSGSQSERTPVEWSGGVGPEIVHWAKKFEFLSELNARVAFVHTTSEIEARISWLVSQGKDAQFLDHAESMLRRLFAKWYLLDEVVSGFFRGKIVDLSPSGLAQNRPNVVKDDPGKVLGWMRAAASVGLTEAYTKLKIRGDEPPANGIPEPISVPSNSLGLFWIEEDEKGLAKDPVDMAAKLCEFFRGPPDAQDQGRNVVDPEDLRNEFWSVHDQIFEQITGANLVEYISRQRGYPYEDLVQATER